MGAPPHGEAYPAGDGRVRQRKVAWASPIGRSPTVGDKLDSGANAGAGVAALERTAFVLAQTAPDPVVLA